MHRVKGVNGIRLAEVKAGRVLFRDAPYSFASTDLSLASGPRNGELAKRFQNG